jgi:hypothetical protein
VQIHGGTNQGIEGAFDAGNECSDYLMASQFAPALNSVRVGQYGKQQNEVAIETYEAAVFLLLIPVERLAVLKPPAG